MTDHNQFMKAAIEVAKKGIGLGQSPFGSVIVHPEKGIVAEAHNSVWKSCDPTAHAEVNAIREAAQILGSIDFSGCTLYTTCEPCPMCLTAIHWAKIDRVVFGATIDDAQTAGFSELEVPAQMMVEHGKSPLLVEKGPLRAECAQLFKDWKAAGLGESY